MAVYLALTNDPLANTGAYIWNNMSELGETITPVDETGAATTHSISWPSTPDWPNVGELAGLSASGDAAWADDDRGAFESAWTNDGTALHTITISGLDDAKVYFVEGFGSRVDGRDTQMSVNGSAVQIIPNGDGAGGPNLTETALFTNISPVSGQITIDWGGTDNWGYLNTVRYGEFTPAASISITQTSLTPGGTISGSYSNFDVVPTSPLLITDKNANSITVAVNITDNGDGTGTFSGTMPADPTSGSLDNLLYGDVTVELT